MEKQTGRDGGCWIDGGRLVDAVKMGARGGVEVWETFMYACMYGQAV